MTTAKNIVPKEELSDQTLELMLFKEMITSSDFMNRASGIMDFRWFRTPHIRIMAEFSVNYYKKYGGLVTRDLMESVIQRRNDSQSIAENRIDLNKAMFDFNKAKTLDLGNMDEETKIGKISRYVKQEALRNALLDSATDLEKKGTDDIISNTLTKFEDIQKIMFEKMDLGYELSKDEIDGTMDEHMEFLTKPAARIETGWNCLDEVTHGGFYRDGKSLYVFMAQAGLGKSNILANLGYNFLKQDKKVMVITMEMTQNVYLRRFDSLITKIDIDDLGVGSLAVQVREKMTNFYKFEHQNARLNIKEFAGGSLCTRTIDQYIEKFVEQKGWKPEVLLVDYLNLIKPNSGSSRGGESTMYEDGKIVSEELRALSYKHGIPVITAVQCNSSGYDTADIGMGNIAQSRGIAHTADFIAGLYQTEDEQLDGIFHMKILKSRLGDKLTLKFEFDKHTMEFRDINDVNSSSETDNAKSIQKTTQTEGVDDIDNMCLFGPDLGMP